jgi:hypothetical protein
MASGSEFLSIEEAARTLGVSVRHAQRLADAGAIAKVARGLVDHDSVDQYLRSQRLGRTRAWSEHTAWGAIALLAGRDADWLGGTQRSRLRGALRDIADADELASRMRDRAQIRRFVAHRAALPRLRNRVASADLTQLGLVAVNDGNVDGYVASGDLASVVENLGLREDAAGDAVLRVTKFSFDQVSELVNTSVVAALDAATSTDPRVRGVGQRTLADLLREFR